MSALIPPAVNYRSPLVAITSKAEKQPIEGSQYIPAEILWTTMGGTGQAVNLNLSGLGAQTFSQIVALSVDNSQCGADIVFIFPDAATQTYTVPAYSPLDVFPVFTGQTQFFVKAIGNLTVDDVTRFTIHNDLPPPISIPTTVAQQNVALGSIAMTGAGATQIVPAGVNGALQNLYVSFAIPNNAAGNFNDSFVFTDGTGKQLATANCAGNAGFSANGQLLSATDLSARFRNGIIMTQTGGFNTGGTISVNLFYRVP